MPAHGGNLSYLRGSWEGGQWREVAGPLWDAEKTCPGSVMKASPEGKGPQAGFLSPFPLAVAGSAWAALLTASFLESCSTRSPSDSCPPGRAGRSGHGVPGALLHSLPRVGAGCTEEAWVAEVGTEGESCTWDLGIGWGLETALLVVHW